VHRVLTADEFDRALEAAPAWLRPALLLAHDAGLRLCEVCGARWQRLDLLHGIVTVSDVILHNGEERAYPKGKKSLPVPLTARTLTALRAHQKQYPGGPTDRVFIEPGTNSSRVLNHRMQYLWNKVVVKAEIAAPRPCFHDPRHGCGHALRNAGAPIDVIQAVLRHQSIETSKICMPDVSDAEARQWLNRTQRAG
jgi:integrase